LLDPRAKPKLASGRKLGSAALVGERSLLNEEPHWESREASGEASYGRSLFNYFRTYDPTVGRYLEADPIGQWDGTNLYLYARGDPINFFDPYGLLTWSEALRRYISGTGGTLNTPFADHDPGLGPAAFPGFSKALADAEAACKCGGGAGNRPYNDSLGVDVGGAPGRVTLELSGNIVCDEQCHCSFQGGIGIGDDRWDFNPEPWGVRDPEGFPYPKEFSTRVGQRLPGAPFTTRFTGRRSVRYGN
jgi:RHS repeat-associated protein